MRKLLANLPWLLLFVFLLAFWNGADTNRHTHCDTRGLNCQPSCDPAKYLAQSETDACYKIQPGSDWTKPLISTNVKDYRP